VQGEIFFVFFYGVCILVVVLENLADIALST